MKDMAKRVFYIGGIVLLIAIAGSVSFYLIAKKPATSVPVSLPEEAAKPEVAAPTPVTAPPAEVIPAPQVVKEEEKVDTSGWKEYGDENLEISFKYPSSWFIFETTPSSVLVSNINPSDLSGGIHTPVCKVGYYLNSVDDPNLTIENWLQKFWGAEEGMPPIQFSVTSFQGMKEIIFDSSAEHNGLYFGPGLGKYFYRKQNSNIISRGYLCSEEEIFEKNKIIIEDILQTFKFQ